MNEKVQAESLFDFLTARNPDIDYRIPKSSTLTSVRNSLYPRQIKIWDDFSFSTLETIYGGRLIAEARQKGRSSLTYPSILANVDNVVHDEPTTTHVLTIWNHRIVAASLQAVQETLHPSIWVPKGGRKGQNKTDASMINASTDNKNGSGSTRLKPDGGAVSFCQNCCSEAERLPKDYKPASKWQSSAVFDGWTTGTAGKWTPGWVKKNDARPIRQAYTYCVEFGCRYGCIITTREAFIFRIGPRTEMPVSGTASGSASKDAALKEVLSKNGLMEYVSIPWDNYRQGNPDDYVSLTVNLALWFVHILAGNAHKVDWSYPDLWDEELATGVCTTSSASENSGAESDGEGLEPPQPRRSLRLGPFSRKRKRNSDVRDDPQCSFAKMFDSFATQSTEQLTEEDTQSCNDDALEKDGEMDLRWAGRSFDEVLPEQIRAPKRLRNGKILPAPVRK